MAKEYIEENLTVIRDTLIDGNLTTSTGIVNKDLEVLGSIFVDKDVSFNIDLSVNNTLYCYNLDVCCEIIAKNISIENLDLNDLQVDNFECTNIDISNLMIITKKKKVKLINIYARL